MRIWSFVIINSGYREPVTNMNEIDIVVLVVAVVIIGFGIGFCIIWTIKSTCVVFSYLNNLSIFIFIIVFVIRGLLQKSGSSPPAHISSSAQHHRF